MYSNLVFNSFTFNALATINETLKSINGLELLALILLIAGFILIALECFVPGFGVCGILGVICLAVDIFLVAKTPLQGLLMFLGLIALITALIALLVRFSRKGQMLKGIILGTSTNAESGFNSANDYTWLVGAPGQALTTLRPAGEVLIAGHRYDVVTQGEYIEKGSDIQVVIIEGNRIVVQSAVQTQAAV